MVYIQIFRRFEDQRWANVDLMLGQRLRHWPNIDPTQVGVFRVLTTSSFLDTFLSTLSIIFKLAKHSPFFSSGRSECNVFISSNSIRDSTYRHSEEKANRETVGLLYQTAVVRLTQRNVG